MSEREQAAEKLVTAFIAAVSLAVGDVLLLWLISCMFPTLLDDNTIKIIVGLALFWGSWKALDWLHERTLRWLQKRGGVLIDLSRFGGKR